MMHESCDCGFYKLVEAEMKRMLEDIRESVNAELEAFFSQEFTGFKFLTDDSI